MLQQGNVLMLKYLGMKCQNSATNKSFGRRKSQLKIGRERNKVYSKILTLVKLGKDFIGDLIQKKKKKTLKNVQGIEIKYGKIEPLINLGEDYVTFTLLFFFFSPC